jgi:LysM repeat protein
VPAAISLAQGILETEAGNSDLVKKSNNHFGIKCKSTWTADTVSHDDDAPGECFRAYKCAEDSYRDHSNFLRGSDRYAFLFRLDPKDYKAWAYGLRRAGYATNPQYPQILIKYIEDNNLEQYTLAAINDVPVFDGSKFLSDPDDKEVKDMPPSGGDTDSGNSPRRTPNLTINGSHAIFASKGSSLLAIATENDINLNRLLTFNDLQQDGLLSRDQYIFLQKKSKVGDRDYFIVPKDETLYDVAQLNGVQLQSLMEYNAVSAANNLSPGTKIFLRPLAFRDHTDPNAGNTSSDAANNGSSAIIKTHEVQYRESLYGIAKKFGVSIDQLREWNNLADNHLRVGQQLIISK